VQVISDFFTEIDRLWPSAETRGPKVRLSIIGSGALMLQASYERGTTDSDVFETTELGAENIVSNGVPFLPQVPVWHSVPKINSALQHLELVVLDVVDVVVSKLKRFLPKDQGDIDAMIERGLVPHERLVERFRSAVDSFLGDARAVELPAWIANLHRVERDMLLVPETEIELPSWI
jgi:Nucleotidyltransferase of unknown function (DUF6036)